MIPIPSRIRQLLILLLALLTLATPSHAGPLPPTLKVVMDDNYPPYVFYGSEGQLQGILIDQWRLWERKTGVKVEISAMDWGKALARMKAGEFDVIDTIFQTEERSGWLDFSPPWVKIEVPIFFNASISGITDAASLKGFVVAAKSGDAAIDFLLQQGIDSLVLFNSYEAVVQAARAHTVNVFVVDAPPALYFLYKLGINTRFKHSAPLYSGEFHRAVLKGRGELLQGVEEGFARISAAERQEIETTWSGSPLIDDLTWHYLIIGAVVIGLLLLILFAWNHILRQVVDRRTAEYRSLFDNALSAVALHEIVLDGQGEPVDYIFLQANPAFERHTGLRVADILGKRVTEVHPGIEHTGLIQTYGRVALTGEAAAFELWFELAQRHYSISAYQAGEGRFAVIFNDITESKRAEEELREREHSYQELFEAESDAVFLIDNQTNRILEANGAAAALYGFSREELLALRNLDLSAEPEATQQATQAPPMVRDQVVIIPLRYHRKKDGSVFPVEITARFFTSRGRAVHIAAIRDISERQRAEAEKEALNAQLLQAQKIESVGRLAGGVAHDFNNMLNVILGYTELAMDRVEAGPIRTDLEQIRMAALRSADLTRQLLAFARKQIIRPRVLDLNETIESMLKILRRLIGEDIQLEWRPQAGLWPVKLDPAQVDQILANLAVNARDAIHGTGALIIETGNVEVDEPFCLGKPDCLPGAYCRLAVADTGTGMDQETICQIFEPFFTTKEVGKGTGLGLATVYGVVKQNGGFIEVRSAPGQGTTFSIYLPRAREMVELPATAEEKRPAQGSETVLLVEDELAILELTARTLSEHGYTVLTASTTARALELAASHQGPIHLLVTDIVMPEMNGKELAEAIAGLRPGIKVIYISGYTAEVIAFHGVLEENVQFLAKPFTVRDLTVKVRAVLDGAAEE